MGESRQKQMSQCRMVTSQQRSQRISPQMAQPQWRPIKFLDTRASTNAVRFLSFKVQRGAEESYCFLCRCGQVNGGLRGPIHFDGNFALSERAHVSKLARQIFGSGSKRTQNWNTF